MKLKPLFIFTLLLTTVIFSCKKKDDVTSPVVGFAVADIIGTTNTSCTNISDATALNGTSYLRSLTVNANSTYSYSVLYFSTTNCTLGGGDNFMNFSQSGNIAINGLSATVTSASELTLTPTSNATLTVYGATSAGSNWAGYLNSYCGGGLSFSISATASQNMSGKTCTRVSAPAFTLDTFPTTTAVQNVGVFVTSPKTLTLGLPSILWSPGTAGSYPTSATLVFTY